MLTTQNFFTGCALSLFISASAFAQTPDTLNLRQLRQALDEGQITSEQLVKFYQDKIQRNNRQGDHLNAVISLNEDALEQARNWDAQRAKEPGVKHGALAGIPYLAKDNIDTQMIPTSGGSWVLRDSTPSRDAFVIERLQSGGAILLGKTNLSELAASYGWLGYSSLGGQTLNPHNLKHDASGSSSGSAAAVAAGFAPFALGSDTSGSIRAPASVTGTVGMRPSLGLISRSGVIPLSLTFDTAGVITRTVLDQAIVLDVIKGSDKADAATANVDSTAMNFVEGLEQSSLKGRTLGVVTNFIGANAQVDAVFEAAQQRVAEKGAKLVRVVLPKRYEELWAGVLGPVGDAEFSSQFERYLSTLNARQPKTLAEFVKLSEQHQQEQQGHLMNPKRLAALKELSEKSETDSPLYISILSNTIPALRTELAAVMRQAGVDALVFPTINCPASVVNGQSDPDYVCETADTYASAYIASATGFPEISVPAGIVKGNLPVGISFLGWYGEDEDIVRIAYAFLGK
ncbi:amidase family protein [Pseudomonas sp. 10-1B]|uniref:amidase family protein n=1 Tax=Pseudomonas sp. 10-1B TaxID=1546029 RepID=UPI0006A7DF46|nr:amidase family protein [Pseudomonas sp. 10-1B]